MVLPFTVGNIRCDCCGFYDGAENFPDRENSPRQYLAVMIRFGHEEDAKNNRGIGTVCPSCGNHYEFDFDPDNKRLKESGLEKDD